MIARKRKAKAKRKASLTRKLLKREDCLTYLTTNTAKEREASPKRKAEIKILVKRQLAKAKKNTYLKTKIVQRKSYKLAQKRSKSNRNTRKAQR